MISLLQPKVVILLYHRVFEASSDPQLLCVTPRHFAEHLKHLRRYYQIMNLNSLIQSLSERRLPRRGIVITFDDGYADNLLNAKPLLEQYDAPAAVFVTTDYVGTKMEFWWDELERILLLSENLPDILTLTIADKVYSWRVENSEIPDSRYKIYKELHAIFCSLDSIARFRILTELVKWAGILEDGRANYRALNFAELKMVNNNGLIEIGSHSCTHSSLSSQPVEAQQIEIIGSKRKLEKILERPIISFSYPFGDRNNVGKEAINLVRNGGYRIAFANFPAAVNRDADIFWLPRYLVRDWDAKEFAINIKKLFRD